MCEEGLHVFELSTTFARHSCQCGKVDMWTQEFEQKIHTMFLHAGSDAAFHLAQFGIKKRYVKAESIYQGAYGVGAKQPGQ